MLDGAPDDHGACWDIRTWFGWRLGTGNRTVWKSVCSLCLCAYISVYFYCVRASIALWICGIVFFGKLLTEIWGQETPTWACPGTPCLFVTMYGFGWPYFIGTFGYCTKTSAIDFPYRGVIAVVIYLFGSFYSLGYEVHRFRWKAKPENAGKLYTIGLGQFCMHPNYFGDLFTYSGWALATGTVFAFNLVLMSVWALWIFVIPNSQEYLARRYPAEFPAYADATSKFVPFLHNKIFMTALAWISLIGSCYCSMDTKACGW